MPLRLIVAYCLTIVLIASLTAAFLYATREWRAHRRAARAYWRANRIAKK